MTPGLDAVTEDVSMERKHERVSTTIRCGEAIDRRELGWFTAEPRMHGMIPGEETEDDIGTRRTLLASRIRRRAGEETTEQGVNSASVDDRARPRIEGLTAVKDNARCSSRDGAGLAKLG